MATTKRGKYGAGIEIDERQLSQLLIGLQKKLPKEMVEEVLAKGLDPVSKKIARTAKTEHGWTSRSGRLKRAIKRQRVFGSSLVSVPVLIKAGKDRKDLRGAYYAPFLEEGAEPGRPVKRRFRRPSRGKKGKISAYRFFAAAFEKHHDAAVKSVERRARKVLGKKLN